MPVRKKAPEDLTAKKALALEVIDRLKKEYPDAGCTLDYDHAWQLLVSVRLAAQCTDARVNIVVEDLFAKYPNVAALAAAEPEDIEAIVKPCGLGHSKARDISACMRVLRDKYGCQVPTVFCNDACHRRFSGTGRAVEDHVRDASALDGTAEHPARCQQMLLTADICQCFGPQTLCQWFVHRVFLLPYRGAIPPAFFYSISHFGSKSKVLSENHSQIIFARSLQKTQNMVLSYQLLSIGVDEMPVRKKAPEDLTAKKALALEVIDRLKKEYPDAGCTLDYDHAWQLLVSVRLAAQCTDARVNIVVEDLFAKYPNVAALAAAEPEDIEAIVKPCGLGHSKARDISACMRVLRDKYGCQVPTTFEELLALPGVGRKSANLIMGDVFGKPAIVTDTHCIRLCNKIGLVDGIKEPQKVEMALWKIVPPEEGSDLCHRFVMHGRAVCNARKPECEKCCLKDICRFARETAGQSAEL